MIIRVAVADTNKEYVKRLLAVLEEYKDISISAYTNEEALQQALAARRFDILLLDPAMSGKEMENGKKPLVIWLSEEGGGSSAGAGGRLGIRKYQRIRRIYQQMLEFYAEVCEDSGLAGGKGNTRIVAYYSPVGGAGKTTLSLAAATKYAMQGCRTFYLNLEEAASEGCYLPQNAERGMSELASCLGENVHFAMKLQGLWQNRYDKLYYLNHFDSPNDLCEMTEEELSELIEQIERTGLFDCLVIDMGTALDAKMRRVFECADEIVLVERADALAAQKLNLFYSQVHIMNEYGGKMVRVVNFDAGKGSAVSAPVPLAGVVKVLPNPEAGQRIAALSQDAGSRFLAQR